MPSAVVLCNNSIGINLMLLTESFPEVKKSGNFKESAFKLKAGSKMFGLLSSKIYENKIKAVIRELSTNAYDAHVAAGNPDPFEVHLPSNMEPYFSIRDFGTGLSEEDVFNVYTTYGESTKDNSDDFVGCLGLGSKSPFCIDGNDSFSVTSYFDGVKYEYTAYINEEGIPQIALINSSRTKAKNGLEVKFSVETHNISSFAREAAIVYKYFPLKPTITGYHITIPDISYGDINGSMVIDGKTITWSVVHDDNSRVIMGNVAYPLSHNWKSSKHAQLTSYCKLLIHVPIGYCNFTVSREALEYNKTTVANLEKVLDQIYVKMSSGLQKTIDDAGSFWEACRVYRSNYYTFNQFLPNPSFNGKPLEYSINIDLSKLKTSVYYSRGYGRGHTEIHNVAFTPEKDVQFIIKDDNLAIKKKAQFLGKKSSGYIYVIESSLADHLKKEYDAPDSVFVLASDCDYDKVVTKSGGVRTSKVLKWSGGSNGSKSWDDAKLKDSDTAIYVEVNRYNVIYDGKTIDYSSFSRIVKEAEKHLGFTQEIYGIKTAILKKAKKNKGWTCFFTTIKPKLEKYVKDNSEKISVREHYQVQVCLQAKTLNKEYNKLKEEYARIEKLYDYSYTIPSKLMFVLGVKQTDLSFWKDLETFLNKYPIVSDLNHRYTKDTDKNIIEYLNLLEKNR